MKKTITLFLAIALAIPAYSKENKNLIFKDPKNSYLEILTSGYCYGSNYSAFGINLGIVRHVQFLKLGFMCSAEYSHEYGMSNSAEILAGLKLRNFSLDILGGYAQNHVKINSSNPINGDFSINKFSIWKPFIGGQIGFNIPLNQNMAISIKGGIKKSFYSPSDLDVDPEGNWRIDKIEVDNLKWYGGISWSYFIKKDRQISGDNCWRASTFGGWSNLGLIAGAKAIHFHRNSYNYGRILGVGTEYTIKNKTASNGIFIQFGYQFLPKGEKSFMVYDFGIEAGFGEYAKTCEASTKDDPGRYQEKYALYSPGVNGKAYIGAAFHCGILTFGVDAYIGSWVCRGSDFAGDFGFDGNHSENAGIKFGANATFSIAL